ncbi:unnamed protein product [Cylicocyclus nassatus]|uniref:Uncharacterized protein n=1 Tax=Cylicocyclus nassatus TaxID=53992 RepID=A0AA36HCT8_CYLNA|nr:unnamed protein product [Cylicocyclus nassatus]
MLWCAIWMYKSFDRPINHPRISEAEKQCITKAVEESVGKHTGKPPSTPKGIILTSRAVWGWFGHFAGDWGAYTMLVCASLDLSLVCSLKIFPTLTNC